MAYVALITGASSGLGEATARRVSREPNTQLVLVARRRERLEQLAAELAPTRTTVIDAHLTDSDAPAGIRDVVQREHNGDLHMLVNNAGGAWRGTFGETGWANVERHMQLGLSGRGAAGQHDDQVAGRPARTVAEAILDAGPGGPAERYTPRPYWLVAASRTLAPAIVRRAVAGGAFTTRTGDRS